MNPYIEDQIVIGRGNAMVKSIAVEKVEKKYIVKKGKSKFYVELARTRDGKSIVSVFKEIRHTIIKMEGRRKEKEDWEYNLDDAEEIEYEKLPGNIRKALGRLI